MHTYDMIYSISLKVFVYILKVLDLYSFQVYIIRGHLPFTHVAHVRA